MIGMVGQRRNGLSPGIRREPLSALQGTVSGNTPPIPSGSAPRQSVRFGGRLGRWGMDASVNTFQKINEVFLWGFLAQDVIAMWLPRVGTSLRVGRVPYDPATDPQKKNQSFPQQMAQWLKGNVQGLNWVNFGEETKREIATGPGLLFLPALIFLGNRVIGNPAMEISYNSLKEMGEGFTEHLKSVGGVRMDRARFQTEVGNYIQKIFLDEKLKKTLGSKLEDWTRAWTGEILKQPEQSLWERLKGTFRKSPLNDQAARLHDMIRNFNREHRVLAYADSPAIRDDAPLHHADQTWIAYRPDAVREAAVKNPKAAEANALVMHQSLHGLTEDLSRFGGYARKVWEQGMRDRKAPLANVAGDVWRGLIAQKFLLCMGTTMATAAYLVRLAFWAQSNGAYQAVRLLQPKKPAPQIRTDVTAGGAPKAQTASSVLHPAAYRPLQATLSARNFSPPYGNAFLPATRRTPPPPNDWRSA